MIIKYDEEFPAGLELSDVYKMLKNKINESDDMIEFVFNGKRLFIDKNTCFYEMFSYYQRANYLWENGVIKEENDLILGDYLFSFDYREPVVGKKIKYLLGNGIDNLNISTLVTGRFNPDFGDFVKDEFGKFKYVSYWKYIEQ